MVTLLEGAGQEIKSAAERLEKTSTAEHAFALEQAVPHLADRIKSGTVTVEEIASFLESFPQVQPEIKEYLLVKRGYLLFQEGRQEEGLRNYDYALSTIEKPSTWAIKGSALLQMNRLDEAFQAFQKAYLLREHFGPQKQEYLKDLFLAWSLAAQLRGLFGILNNHSNELGKGVEAYLQALESSRKVGFMGQ